MPAGFHYEHIKERKNGFFLLTLNSNNNNNNINNNLYLQRVTFLANNRLIFHEALYFLARVMVYLYLVYMI